MRLFNRINSHLLIKMNLNSYLAIFKFLKHNLIEYLFQSDQPLTLLLLICHNSKVYLFRFKDVDGVQQGLFVVYVDCFVYQI